MDKKTVLQSLFWIAGVIGTILIATNIGIGLGEKTSASKIDALNEKLKFYSETDKLKLPELIKEMSSTTKSLSKAVSDSELLLKTQSENDLLREQNELLQTKLDKEMHLIDSLGKINTEQSKNLNTIKNDFQKLIAKSKTFEIKDGESEYLIPNNLLLGVTYIFSNSVDFNLDGKSHKLEIGQKLEQKIGGSTAIITLMKVIEKKTFENNEKDIAQFDFTFVAG